MRRVARAAEYDTPTRPCLMGARWKRRGVMDRVNAIPKELRCKECAGFGFVYRTSKDGTRILEVKCVCRNKKP